MTQVGVVTRVHPTKKPKAAISSLQTSQSSKSHADMIQVDKIFPNNVLDDIKSKMTIDRDAISCGNEGNSSADCNIDDDNSAGFNLPSTREDAESRAFSDLSDRGREILTLARGHLLSGRQFIRQQRRIAVSPVVDGAL